VLGAALEAVRGVVSVVLSKGFGPTVQSGAREDSGRCTRGVRGGTWASFGAILVKHGCGGSLGG
jgi:hypothetical protein